MSKCLVCNISKDIMKQMGVEYSYVKESELEISMKDLVLKNNNTESYIEDMLPFIYMFDYEEEMMSYITNTIKSKGIHAIFAASTPHNLQWTLQALIKELKKEHFMMQVMKQLQDEIKKTMTFSVNENSEKVKNTLMAAFIALQNQDLAIMQNMIQELIKIQKESD